MPWGISRDALGYLAQCPWVSREMLFGSREMLFGSPEMLFASPEMLFGSHEMLFGSPAILVVSREILFVSREILGTPIAQISMRKERRNGRQARARRAAQGRQALRPTRRAGTLQRGRGRRSLAGAGPPAPGEVVVEAGLRRPRRPQALVFFSTPRCLIQPGRLR